jgi:hypothetical protein
VAVWQDFSALDNRVYSATSSDGVTWSSAVRVDDVPQGAQAFRPRVADGGGSPFVVWEDTRTGRRQLAYRR